MNYSDYKIEDWIIDDDFIAYVNGADNDVIENLSADPEYSEKIKEAKVLVNRLSATKPQVNSEKLDAIYRSLSEKIKEKSKPQIKILTMRWVGIAAAAAAVFIIALPFFLASDSNHITQIAQQEEIILPDDTKVTMNSLSSIRYNKRTWNKHRYLVLQGEAFFDVEEGSTFMVKSNQGIVTVLGTQFNIRDRLGFYEVECVQGKVEVVLETGNTYVLEVGDKVTQVEGQQAILTENKVKEIDWLQDYITVDSLRLNRVLEEVQRHYDVKIEKVDSSFNKKYSGFFTTTSLDSAMQQILWPLDIEFEIVNNKVILKESE